MNPHNVISDSAFLENLTIRHDHLLSRDLFIFAYALVPGLEQNTLPCVAASVSRSSRLLRPHLSSTNHEYTSQDCSTGTA
jgi:hypothetical protein